MENFNHQRIQDLIENGFNFNMEQYLSESFNIVKKEMGLFIGYTVVFGLIILTSAFIPFIGSIITNLVSPILMAGYMIVAHKIHRNETVEFGDFFKSFDYFSQLILQALILFGIILLIFIPFGLIAFLFIDFDTYVYEDLPFNMVLMFIFFGILMIMLTLYIMTSYLFASAFVVFGDMQAWEAMEASRKIVARNFFAILGFTIVLGLIMLCGYLLCCLGLLMAVPIYQVAIYFAFNNLMNLDSHDSHDGNDIYNHFVD